MPVDRNEQHHDRPDRVGEPDEVRVPQGAEPSVAGRPVVVRRHAGVAALVGYAASAVAIAYLWRASQTAAVLDWALFVVMTLVAAVYLSSLVDARTPLLVADDLGVRIRLGKEWRGLPWEAIGQVAVHPRKGLLRDGRLVFAPRSLARALDGLDVKARRHVALNQKMYGAPLAVPLGSTTRVSLAGGSEPIGSKPGSKPGSKAGGAASRATGIAGDIAALARGRADVVVLDPQTLEVLEGDPREGRDTPDGKTPTGQGPGLAEEAVSHAAGTRTAEPAGEVRRDDAGNDAGDAAGDGPTATPATPATPAARTRQVVFPAVDTYEAGDTRRGDVGRSPQHEAPAEADAPGAASADEAAGTHAPAGRPAAEPAPRGSRRSILGRIGTIVSRVAKGRSQDVDVVPDGTTAGSAEPSAAAGEAAAEPTAPAPRPTAALRETRPGLRAEARLDLSPTAGSAALDSSRDHDTPQVVLPEGRELRRPGSVDLVFERVEIDDRVRPISTLGDAVEPLVIDDFVTEPAYDPVIGPELTAARNRLGLSVDDLSERTRIRPHVIESIEVDDFAPCGGDFYARGHLRTLARILGKDAEPLLQKFEERYATAPINARRVFEAELATGMTGSMRSTIGGPSWGLLVGVVLFLVLVWGVLRLFTTEPPDVQAPVIHGSGAVVAGHHAPLPPRTL